LQGNPTDRDPISFLPFNQGQKSQDTNGETITALSIFDKQPRNILSLAHDMSGAISNVSVLPQSARGERIQLRKSNLRSGPYLMQ